MCMIVTMRLESPWYQCYGPTPVTCTSSQDNNNTLQEYFQHLHNRKIFRLTQNNCSSRYLGNLPHIIDWRSLFPPLEEWSHPQSWWSIVEIPWIHHLGSVRTMSVIELSYDQLNFTWSSHFCRLTHVNFT